MNDEIKEILNMFTKYKDQWYSVEYKLKPKQCVILYDYITNLQTIEKLYDNKLSENKLLKQELINLQHQISLMEEDIRESKEINGELQQENERLKEIKPCMLNFQECYVVKDYKSCCEKASEIIKKEKEIMGYAKYDSCLLLIENILQNGSEENEC